MRFVLSSSDIMAAHKLLVTGLHESLHAVVGLACGGRISWWAYKTTSLDPRPDPSSFPARGAAYFMLLRT